LPAGGDSVDGDGGTSGAVAGCEVEAGVTASRSGPGSRSVQFAQIAAMSVPVKAERASLAPDVVRALTAEVVTPDVHRALPVGVVQSVLSPQTASVSLTHQHELQRAMITNVDSDKAQSHRLKTSAEATGGSDNGITNLESAGALLQQERALIVSQSDVGSQLQQVCEAQVPRRSTASSVDDGGLGGLQRLEIWTGKSQAPERFGILLRLWSLLLRRQGGIILRSIDRPFIVLTETKFSIVIIMVDTSSGGTEMS
jgi:hypothetical protein